MPLQTKKVLNYYFLNKYLHPDTPAGYRENIAIFITNKAEGPQRGKILLIQEKNRVWTLPKKGVDSDNLFEGIINAFVQNIGGEMGFRGLVVNEIKPHFTQRAFLINFARQSYDKTRSEYEKGKDRPGKGKLYHMVFVEYFGPERLPVKDDLTKSYIMDYRWVTLMKVANLSNQVGIL